MSILPAGSTRPARLICIQTMTTVMAGRIPPRQQQNLKLTDEHLGQTSNACMSVPMVIYLGTKDKHTF